MLRFIVIPITLLLALAVPVHAQTLEQAAKLEGFLDRTTSELAQATTNLLQMAEGLPIEDGMQVDTLYESIKNTDCYFQQLNTVAKIYSVMQDSRDRVIVKNFISILAKASVKEANSTIKILNRVLAKMRSSAAIAEVQKARDLVQKIRDEIQLTIPGS